MQIKKKGTGLVRECKKCGAFIARDTLRNVVQDMRSVVVMRCGNCGALYEVRKPMKIFAD
jgi:uncharacterized Zn finger protein